MLKEKLILFKIEIEMNFIIKVNYFLFYCTFKNKHYTKFT